MASAKIDDLCNCKICFNMFGDKDICPRMLTCGHTFCHACLQRFISDKSDCPTCHKDINFKSADDISINFLAKSLAETFNVSNKTHEVIEANETVNQVSMNGEKSSPKEELPYNGHCEKHYLQNHFKCLNCQEYICGICATLMHKKCLQVFPVLEAMNSMKEEKLKKINASNCKLAKDATQLNTDFKDLKSRHTNLKREIKTVKKEMYNKRVSILNNNKLSEQLRSLKEKLDADDINEEYEKTDSKLEFLFQENFQNLFTILSKEESFNLSRKDFENCNVFVMKREKEQKKQFAKVQLLENKIVFNQWETKVDDDNCIFVDLSDFLDSRDVVCYAKGFFEKHKDVIQNPKLGNLYKYSTVEKSDDGTLRFKCFRNETNDECPINFESVLKVLQCSTVVPTKAFLKIQNVARESCGEVLIEAYDINPISLNFLLSASGLCKTSYKEKTFGDCGETYTTGGYLTEPNCDLAVVDGIKETELPQRTIKTGSVRGGNLNAYGAGYIEVFDVYKKRANKISLNDIFGEVFRGLEVIETIQDGDIIKECGFLIG